ncbi:hypothetical protein RY831_16225 [Noviherbaspirillum sp. CPCC 100848]|uniref:MFS transporter n=1 Tax=Noviherbaspirillum album TaxID=3080276 RepID=A0ABU6JBA0_9BURK|nr:hypothetical protein [Noviherbaspirillum sp. CPCC 100848]MEC4720711.1 hypothetical protein [Noviherbaspirillum sp. CPCC 100848]
MRVPGPRIAYLAISLLMMATIAIAYLSHALFEPVRQSQASIRVEMDAAAVAAPLNRALTVGVPLAGLQGVDAFLQSRLRRSPHLLGIEIRDLDGNILWKQGETGAGSAISGKAPLLVQEEVVATVVLNAGAQTSPASFIEALFIIAMATLAAGILLYEAVHLVRQRSLLSRDAVVRHAQDAARAGNWLQVFAGEGPHPQDYRSRFLRAEVRLINEQFERIERLISSLRRTEPSRLRRAEMDHVLEQALGKNSFAEGRPVTVRVESFFSEARWVALLLCSAAAGLQVLLMLDGSGPARSYYLIAGLCGVLGAAVAGPRFLRNRMRYQGMLTAWGLISGGMLLALILEHPLTLLAACAMAAFGAGCTLHSFACSDVAPPAGAVLNENEQPEWPVWGMLAGAQLVGPVLAVILSPLVGKQATLLILGLGCTAGVALIWRGRAKTFWSTTQASSATAARKPQGARQQIAGFGCALLWLYWTDHMPAASGETHSLQSWALVLAGWCVFGLAVLGGFHYRSALTVKPYAILVLTIAAGAATALLVMPHTNLAGMEGWLHLLATAGVGFGLALACTLPGHARVGVPFFVGALLAAMIAGAGSVFAGLAQWTQLTQLAQWAWAVPALGFTFAAIKMWGRREA